MAVEIRVLGHVDALVDGRSLPLRGSKQRGVLAMLALHANRTVSADALIDGLWGERPPASAAKNIQTHVSRLRRALASDDCGASIVTHGRGYQLRVAEEAVDALRFEDLVEEATRQPTGAGANGLAGAALELWRGAPLADVASEPFAAPEIGRLEELHMRAIELAIDADLAAGRHAEVVAWLEVLIAEEPLRESLHAQRMLALYRAGRQSEALEAYREARETLIEQTGLEPGSQLRRLQEQILVQDPALETPPPVVELPIQLEGGSPLLAGRERELGWLRRRWARAREGRVVCVMVWGPAGIGKTRLVAELAAEVQQGAAVLYAGGGEVTEAALATVAEAGTGHRPTLLVLDYADDAPPGVLEAAAALARAPEGRPLMVCALHHDEQGPPAFAGLLTSGVAERLRLDPLNEDATAEIAALYTPAEGAAMPLETLIVESAGVPLRIHRAADEWARTEAAERLVATTGRAMSERPGLRTTEAELAGNVVDLQLVRERRAFYLPDAPPGPSEWLICPYRGLAPFDAAHAEYFFGRERLVAELVARLVGSTLLAVVGPSGSGKSSAVRAGLMPALAGGVVPGSEGWRQAVMRPGGRPLAELSRTLARAVPEAGREGAAPWIADALDRLPDGERLVLCVDQFEEAFVACRDGAEREAFFDALVEGAGDPDERLVIVLAIRGDFYARCAEHAELSTLVSANQLLVGPMRRDELRRAIELPARRAGLRVEARLVSALVGDVAGVPGGLPLLSAALLELWQRREGRTLRYAPYERSGGVEGAVARLAEDAYQRLSPAERRRARPMLLRLAGAEEKGAAEGFVRRRVSLDELELERDPDAGRALSVLTESRLLTIDEDAVEVAHEALLREWPRLRRWLEEDAEGRRLHRHVIHAAGEWRDSGRDPAELYRGARLASALDWAAGHDPELNQLERAFLDESRAASEREAERQRRTNRRLRTLLAGVGVLLAAAVVAGLIAISERQGARSAATVADAERLGAQALAEDHLDRALRLASAGLALDDSVATRSSLLSTLLRSPAAIGVLSPGGEEALLALALSPDGRTLAVSDAGGTVTLFDTETREVVGEHQAPGTAFQIAFDPQGDSLAVAEDSSATGTLEILDAATGRVRSSTSLAAGQGFAPLGIAIYAPDGRSLFVPYSRGDSLFLRRYDARRGASLGKPVRVGPQLDTPPLMTPDGRLVVSTQRGVKAIDADTLGVIRRYPVGGGGALSPDGRTLAFSATDGRVRLLDLASGRVRTLTGAGAGDPRAFSPDGRTLSTAEDGGSVILWNVEEGVPIVTFEGHAGLAESHAFSPDGRTLYTAGNDGRVIVWDVAGERRLGRPFPRGLGGWEPGSDYPPAFALSPDGRALAVAKLDGRVELIDAETLRRTAGFEAFPGRAAVAIDYSADGRRLAVAGEGGGVGVWDVESQEQVGALLRAPRGPRTTSPRTVQALAFGQGDLLAAAEMGGAVRIWDVGRSELLRPPLRLPPSVLGLAFSPDGSHLAIPFGASSDEGPDGVEILDVASGERVARLSTDGEVRSVAFSPDGSLLAGGQVDGGALLWATDGWRRVGRPLARRTASGDLESVSTLHVEFSPDGHTLATSQSDHSVALWDVASQEPIGPLLLDPASHGGEIAVTARFTPDGAHLFVLSDPDHPGEGGASNLSSGIRWEVDPAAWRRQACRLMGGGLTPEEWEEIAPEHDYIEVCPSG